MVLLESSTALHGIIPAPALSSPLDLAFFISIFSHHRPSKVADDASARQRLGFVKASCAGGDLCSACDLTTRSLLSEVDQTWTNLLFYHSYHGIITAISGPLHSLHLLR